MEKRTVFALCIAFVVTTANWAHADKLPRFGALLTNGNRVQGQVITEWHTATSQPKLDGQPLLDAANPARWVRDRAVLPTALPKAFIETICGDRLPGSVLDYQTGEESPYDPLPAHFVVRPEIRLAPPQPVSEPRVRVLAKFVRRLVWQRREIDEYQPGTLFYRDGRSVSFRAARFADGIVNLLLPEGQRKIHFGEIAELHLPVGDAWSAYFDELSALCPNGSGRLQQLETADGLIATAAMERFGANGTADYLQCVHGVQPAWSLEILWVPTVQVWIRRFFSAHEVPLSRLRPAVSVQKSLLGGPGQPWKFNRNVQSGVLRSGGQEFGWGLGVHAFSELQFDLPSLATAFRTTVGLDRISGKGGCAQARIFVGAAGTQPLFESPLLIGSDNAFDSGELLLSSSGTSKRLILQVDAAHDNRPPGTDPFDIRDMTDWLDPILHLDPERLQAELVARGAKHLFAWEGWQLRLDESNSAKIQWATLRDRWLSSPGRFVVGSLAVNRPFRLEQEVMLGPDHNWLVMAVSHSSEMGTNARLEVRVSGELVGEFAVPAETIGAGLPPPLAVSLREFRGQKVKLQVIQSPSTAAAPVFWRAVRIVEQLPSLYQLFDDEGTFRAVEGSQNVTSLWMEEERHSGSKSLQVSPGGELHLSLKNPIAIREKPGLGEYRYLNFAVRKAGEGRFSFGFTSDDATDAPLRYDGGQGEAAHGFAKRIWQDKMQDKWIEMPRDLFADFGPVNISGITVSALDGGPARFDRAYLGRSIADFEGIAQIAAPPVNPTVVTDALRPAVVRVAPSTVGIRFEDGRFSTGIIISGDGEVLTAGHAVIQPNRPAQLFLNDGRVATAQTRGVFRDQDWGLLKIVDPGAWPPAELLLAPELPRNLHYVALAFPKSFVAGDALATPTATLRHVVPRVIRCEGSQDELSVGGPLLDQYGRVVGIRSGESRLGDTVYTRFIEFPPVLARLKNGEVWGQWPMSAAPSLGVELATAKSGCRITRLYGDAAAARAGLVMGDVLTKINDIAVRDPDDVFQLLTSVDPGQSVEVTYQRGAATHTASVTVGARVP